MENTRVGTVEVTVDRDDPWTESLLDTVDEALDACARGERVVLALKD